MADQKQQQQQGGGGAGAAAPAKQRKKARKNVLEGIAHIHASLYTRSDTV